MKVNNIDANKKYTQEEIEKLVAKSQYYKAKANDVDDLVFQAEDGIRYIGVTGVQTCALPILGRPAGEELHLRSDWLVIFPGRPVPSCGQGARPTRQEQVMAVQGAVRSPREIKRAVVTGGAGFLGSHLCEHLLGRGVEVVCLDNFLTGSPENVLHLMEHPGFRLVRCDVTDYVHVPGPVDLVLHFASPASPLDYLKMPIETLKVGSTGTLHTLGLAKEKGARYFLASTSETYGDPQIHPQPETYWGHVNPVGPRGVYDEAKRFAEAMTMAYRRTHNVNTTIIRIFNSVLADEQVLYDDGETLRRERVGDLAARIGDTVALDGYTVPAFDGDGSVTATEATWLVGHPTEARCYEVRTRYGRTIKVTGDHSLFVRGA